MDGPEVFGGHEALTRPALRWPYGNAKTTVGMGRRREIGMRPPRRRCFSDCLSSRFLFFFLEFVSRFTVAGTRIVDRCSSAAYAASLGVGGRPERHFGCSSGIPSRRPSRLE